MRKTKVQKGITLVALVITIIVLLILAVVAIGAVRDSGIIGHAQNSADKYNTEKGKEESMLGEYEDVISKYPITNAKEDAEEKGIEYYVFFGALQKIDRITGTATVYDDYDKKDGNMNQLSSTKFEEGAPTTEDKTIKLEDEEVILTAGAIPLIVNGFEAAYFSNNKLYGVGQSGIYTVFELVTDKAEIAKIEAAIANIK